MSVIEFKLSMQSLSQPEILVELDRRLNIVSQDFSSHEQMILSLALTEEYVTNERLRYVLGLHKSDITLLLQQMCRQNLLLSEGYGRGTKYRLIDRVMSDNGDSSVVNGDSYVAKGDSNTLSYDETIYSNLSAKAQALLKKKRLNTEEMGCVVCEICMEWRTIQEIANVLGKSVIHLRNNILSTLISNGLLEREFPSIPNHPNQRYRGVSSSSSKE